MPKRKMAFKVWGRHFNHVSRNDCVKAKSWLQRLEKTVDENVSTGKCWSEWENSGHHNITHDAFGVRLCITATCPQIDKRTGNKC